MAARMPQRYNSLVKRLEDGEGGGKARKEDVIETLMELGELEQGESRGGDARAPSARPSDLTQ